MLALLERDRPSTHKHNTTPVHVVDRTVDRLLIRHFVVVKKVTTVVKSEDPRHEIALDVTDAAQVVAGDSALLLRVWGYLPFRRAHQWVVAGVISVKLSSWFPFHVLDGTNVWCVCWVRDVEHSHGMLVN